MRYLGRELRKLYEIEVYMGDPDDEFVETETLTVVAWNTVDALRRTQGRHAAKEPVCLNHVSWDEPPKIIHDTSGPLDKEIEADFGLEEDDF